MAKKLVIFDLDGTLIDSLPDIVVNVNITMEKFGYKKRTNEEIMSFVGHGAREIVRKSIGEEVEESKLDEILAFYNKTYTDNSNSLTKIFDDMGDVLIELKSRGYKLAIITNKPQMTTDRVYDFYLKDFGFDEVIGQSDNFPRKPDSASTLYLLNKFGVEKNDAYFVGDGETDVLTAINSGILPVAVLWGYRSKKILENTGAKIFAYSPLDLLKILK